MDDREIAFTKRVGSRVALARRQLGISKTELAETIGVPETTLDQYEQGHATISACMLYRVADMFQLPMEFFVDDAPVFDWFGDGQLFHSYQKLDRRRRRELVRFMRLVACDSPIKRN